MDNGFTLNGYIPQDLRHRFFVVVMSLAMSRRVVEAVAIMAQPLEVDKLVCSRLHKDSFASLIFFYSSDLAVSALVVTFVVVAVAMS